jgi:hypothetical protein
MATGSNFPLDRRRSGLDFGEQNDPFASDFVAPHNGSPETGTGPRIGISRNNPMNRRLDIHRVDHNHESIERLRRHAAGSYSHVGFVSPLNHAI